MTNKMDILFYEKMKLRRSCRQFSNKPVDINAVLNCIKSAATAPSGANCQPWFFSIITDSVLKQKIRIAAEKEEYLFYNERATKECLSDLKPFKTNWQKPHLEQAPVLAVIFLKSFEYKDGIKKNTYYAKESTGIATGILITAIHHIGLSSLTHTPNPMIFLNQILGRPKNEKPFLILAIGHKDDKYIEPSIKRKEFADICAIY